MHTITLSRGTNCWLARHTDPEIVRLFGRGDAVELPTAFGPGANAATVLAEITRLNPDKRVSLA